MTTYNFGRWEVTDSRLKSHENNFRLFSYYMSERDDEERKHKQDVQYKMQSIEKNPTFEAYMSQLHEDHMIMMLLRRIVDRFDHFVEARLDLFKFLTDKIVKELNALVFRYEKEAEKFDEYDTLLECRNFLKLMHERINFVEYNQFEEKFIKENPDANCSEVRDYCKKFKPTKLTSEEETLLEKTRLLF